MIRVFFVRNVSKTRVQLRMKRNIKSLLKFFLLSAVTVVFTVLIFRIFKAANPTFDSFVGKRELIIGKGIEPLGPLEVRHGFVH